MSGGGVDRSCEEEWRVSGVGLNRRCGIWRAEVWRDGDVMELGGRLAIPSERGTPV